MVTYRVFREKTMKERGWDFKVLRRDFGLTAEIIEKLKHDRYMNMSTAEKICNTLLIEFQELMEYRYEQGTAFKYYPNRK